MQRTPTLGTNGPDHLGLCARQDLWTTYDDDKSGKLELKVCVVYGDCALSCVRACACEGTSSAFFSLGCALHASIAC